MSAVGVSALATGCNQAAKSANNANHEEARVVDEL